MGFISALYLNLKPHVQTSVFFRSVAEEASPKPGVFKYRLTLEDSKVWVLYALPDNGISPT